MDYITRTEYLRFEKHPRDEKKKTDVFTITARDSSLYLGLIKWHGAWRKYVLYLVPNHPFFLIYDTKCLKDIIEFIDKLMEERKDDRKSKE